MKTWITADWHLGESRMQIMQRPFSSPQEMIDRFVSEHNALVKPDDRVIVVGDVCNQTTPDFLSQVSRFNGQKTLVRGNHDRVFTDEQFRPYFDEIVDEGNGIDATIGGIDCYITHYPSRGDKKRFNLVGHIHSAWKFQLNMVNIGVDVHHFRPVDIEEFVPFAYKAIGFYDDDVWIAYKDQNTQYCGIRGKPGVYFSEVKV